MLEISASILAAHPLCLGDAIRQAEQGGADSIHVDIMDGHYVKNLTFGPHAIQAMKQHTRLPVEAHLEVLNPEEVFGLFIEAGADRITVQLDCCHSPIRVLRAIRSAGCMAGVAVNPACGVAALEYLAEYLDYVVIMSVEPGFGGQPFEPSVYGKLRDCQALLKAQGRQIRLAVDGGVCPENAGALAAGGADILIAGSSIFGVSAGIAASIAALRSHAVPVRSE